jgi:hypothetical protein
MSASLGAQEASVSGRAERIPFALKAQQSAMTAQIQITRAGTGKVEEYTLTFTPIPESQPKEAE